MLDCNSHGSRGAIRATPCKHGWDDFLFFVDPCLTHRLSSERMTTHQNTDRAWFFFRARSKNIQTRCTARTQKTLSQIETQSTD